MAEILASTDFSSMSGAVGAIIVKGTR
jgi:hypothetical protein